MGGVGGKRGPSQVGKVPTMKNLACEEIDKAMPTKRSLLSRLPPLRAIKRAPCPLK
jgi:hypothetical protein